MTMAISDRDELAVVVLSSGKPPFVGVIEDQGFQARVARASKSIDVGTVGDDNGDFRSGRARGRSPLEWETSLCRCDRGPGFPGARRARVEVHRRRDGWR